MPNQRKEGKKKVGVWLTDEERERLEKLAKEKGYGSISDLLKAVIKAGGRLGVLLAFAYWQAPSATTRALKMAVSWVGGF